MTTNAASDGASLQEQLAVLRADVAASSDADTVAAATAATSSAERERREALLRGDDGCKGDPAGLLSELEVERDRVLRSAAKLEESNAELKAAIAAGEDADDRELRTAFGENIVIIAKYRARAAALEEEARKARGVRGSGASVAVEPQWLARPESGERGGGERGGGGSGTAAAAAAAAAAAPPPPVAAAQQPASGEAAAATTTVTATEGGGDVWL